MTNVPVGTGPQNLVTPASTQPTVLATPKTPVANIPTIQSAPLTQNILPVQNIPGQTISAANISSATSKAPSNSPWDDDIDVPESPAKNNPTIIGSLDPKAAQPKTIPAPLKLPENMEEKVGQKIPATNFFGAKNSQPAEISPVPMAPSVPPVSGSQLETQAKPKVLSRLFDKFKKEKTIPNNVEMNPGAVSNLKPELESKVEKENRNSIFKKILILVPGLVVVFALATLLTEAGLLSIGVENAYGALGIEQVWGGLSPKTEKALGRSVLEMQAHPDFKAEGKISITIDRAIQSDIVTPLLTLTAGQSLARDESINSSEKAFQAASDDYYFTTNTNSDASSNLNSNSTSDFESDSDVVVNSNSTNNFTAGNGSDNSATLENDGILNQETDLLSGTKLVEGAFDLKTGPSGNEVSVKINDSMNSTISLVNDSNQLFVKSSGAVDYGSAEGKWLVYEMDQLKDKSLVTSLLDLNIDSGFSVKGARVGNEKVDGIRCYKYRIDSLEIGSSLASIGITSDMLPTLSGDVWIGIKDKLIHRLSVKITTPVSSAVRIVNFDADFSDFDVKNSITKVSSSEQMSKQNLSGDDKRKKDVSELLAALKKYKDDNKSYPVAADLLKLNSSDNAVTKALVPRYLTSLPEDPTAKSTGWYYAYKSADGTKCSVSARLENQSDNEGSLVNNVLLYFKYSSD